MFQRSHSQGYFSFSSSLWAGFAQTHELNLDTFYFQGSKRIVTWLPVSNRVKIVRIPSLPKPGSFSYYLVGHLNQHHKPNLGLEVLK